MEQQRWQHSTNRVLLTNREQHSCSMPSTLHIICQVQLQKDGISLNPEPAHVHALHAACNSQKRMTQYVSQWPLDPCKCSKSIMALPAVLQCKAYGTALMTTIRHQQQPLVLAHLSTAHDEGASEMAQSVGTAGCSTWKDQTCSMLTAAKWLQNTHAAIHSCHSDSRKWQGRQHKRQGQQKFGSNDCHAQHAVVKGLGGHHAMIGLTWVPEHLAKASTVSLKMPAVAVLLHRQSMICLHASWSHTAWETSWFIMGSEWLHPFIACSMQPLWIGC